MDNNTRKIEKIILCAVATITVLVIIISSVFRFGGMYKKLFTKSGPSLTTSVDADAFKEIKIDANVADLSIEYSDSYNVEYSYPEKIAPEIKASGDVLEIKQRTNNYVTLNANDDYKIKITVPEGAVFTKVDISVDAGNIEFDELTTDWLKINADAGNIELDKITVNGSTKIDADAGNIEIDNSTLEDISVDADLGNIEIDNSTAKKVNLSADMGNVEFSGQADSIDVKCSLGAIAITCDTASTKMNLDADLGSITVNGKDYGNSYKN